MAGPWLETTALGHCLVARVTGEMDYRTAATFRAQFNELIRQGDRPIVLDLTSVSFCDSAGLGVLLGARRQAATNETMLALACVPLPLRQILEMTGADQVLPVYDTVDDAAAALGS
ncbi:STAS domain-containing protein [Streptomyces carpinensis]|uniref:Anti-sigma factor antagonist n=1 Tax=Streptomyces carpinensis TaxID=66369 RepID=A0ABV1W0H8_9ACTN|nr:STAS domain-containing protein [Streptomyces carpinensis]